MVRHIYEISEMTTPACLARAICVIYANSGGFGLKAIFIYIFVIIYNMIQNLHLNVVG